MQRTFNFKPDRPREPQPARMYVAKAVQSDDGFHAVFAAPGLVPRKVTRPDAPNKPIPFPTKKAAEEEARRALFGILNAPRINQRRGKDVKYQKLSGPEFAVLLAESGLSLTLFSYLYGTSPERAQTWIDGVDFAPHPARVLLEIFKANPEMVDLAEKVTDEATTPR